MSKSPAFQFYVKQWLGDDKVMLMSWEARGMHMHLICIAWQQDIPGTLPDDDEMIRAWLGHPSDTDWERLKKQIFRAWTLENGRWVQKGLLETHERQAAYSESRSKAAKARWSSKKETAASKQPEPVDAYAMHTQCESTKDEDAVEDVVTVKEQKQEPVTTTVVDKAATVFEMRKPAASQVVMQGSIAVNGGPLPYTPSSFSVASAFPPVNPPAKPKPITEQSRDQWSHERYMRHPKKRGDLADAYALLDFVYDQGPEERQRFDRHHEVMCKSFDWNKEQARFCPKIADYVRNKQYYEPLPGDIKEPEPEKQRSTYPEVPEL